jgi:hypothetical protein
VAVLYQLVLAAVVTGLFLPQIGNSEEKTKLEEWDVYHHDDWARVEAFEQWLHTEMGHDEA